jgi:hypothetical protein
MSSNIRPDNEEASLPEVCPEPFLNMPLFGNGNAFEDNQVRFRDLQQEAGNTTPFTEAWSPYCNEAEGYDCNEAEKRYDSDKSDRYCSPCLIEYTALPDFEADLLEANPSAADCRRDAENGSPSADYEGTKLPEAGDGSVLTPNPPYIGPNLDPPTPHTPLRRSTRRRKSTRCRRPPRAEKGSLSGDCKGTEPPKSKGTSVLTPRIGSTHLDPSTPPTPFRRSTRIRRPPRRFEDTVDSSVLSFCYIRAIGKLVEM